MSLSGGTALRSIIDSPTKARSIVEQAMAHLPDPVKQNVDWLTLRIDLAESILARPEESLIRGDAYYVCSAISFVPVGFHKEPPANCQEICRTLFSKEDEFFLRHRWLIKHRPGSNAIFRDLATSFEVELGDDPFASGGPSAEPEDTVYIEHRSPIVEPIVPISLGILLRCADWSQVETLVSPTLEHFLQELMEIVLALALVAKHKQWKGDKTAIDEAKKLADALDAEIRPALRSFRGAADPGSDFVRNCEEASTFFPTQRYPNAQVWFGDKRFYHDWEEQQHVEELENDFLFQVSCILAAADNFLCIPADRLKPWAGANEQLRASLQKWSKGESHPLSKIDSGFIDLLQKWIPSGSVEGEWCRCVDLFTKLRALFHQPFKDDGHLTAGLLAFWLASIGNLEAGILSPLVKVPEVSFKVGMFRPPVLSSLRQLCIEAIDERFCRNPTGFSIGVLADPDITSRRFRVGLTFKTDSAPFSAKVIEWYGASKEPKAKRPRGSLSGTVWDLARAAVDASLNAERLLTLVLK